MSTYEKISRRTWLTRIALFTGAAGALSLLLASRSSAEAKASKSTVRYQNSHQGQMCGTCKFFIPSGGRGRGMMGGGMAGGGMMGGGMIAAGSCQVVEGRITPTAWCILYAPI